MIYDSLTLASYAIIIFTLILVFGSMYYSHKTMKKNMKTLARNTILMSKDDQIRQLCERLMEKDPNACPLLDGDASKMSITDPEKLKALLKKQLG